MKNSLVKSNIGKRDSNKLFSSKSEVNYPLVSVIIPLYNHEKYIVDTLDSIITQNYPNIEIVLVDDGSKDKGLQLAKNKLSSIKFNHAILENVVNKGISATVNKGVSKAKGKYTCLIASDDLLAKGRIKQHIQILEKSTDPLVVACNSPIEVFEVGNSQLRKILKTEKNHTFESILTKKSNITLQGCTFITQALKKLSFDEELFFEDWDVFIRFFYNNHKMIYDNNISAHYRKHDGGTNLNVVKMIESRNKIKEKYFEIIASKNKKLANNFVFTIDYWNLIGMSYQGYVSVWIITCIKIFIKNPINMIKKLKDIAWAFRNLLRNK